MGSGGAPRFVFLVERLVTVEGGALSERAPKGFVVAMSLRLGWSPFPRDILPGPVKVEEEEVKGEKKGLAEVPDVDEERAWAGSGGM